MVARQVAIMPRAARRYDIYLPLTYNDGRLIADELFRVVQRRLLGRFGGVTAQQQESPLQGMWQSGGRVYHDQVIVMTALDFHRHGSTRFIAELKHALLADFEQLDILITEQSLRVH